MSITDCPSTAGLRRSAVHALAMELGARTVPFAGFELPVQFPPGIRREHLHTRARASLFDISHMGQIEVTGAEAPRLLEELVPSDIAGLAPMQQRYTLLTNDRGGVIDDVMVTRFEDSLWIVVNGACRDRDFDWISTHLGTRCRVRLHADRALLALQGPESARVLAPLCPDPVQLRFMHAGTFDLAGTRVLIHRCGYTGEDGFEISVAATDAERVARALLSQSGVAPAGLGARDSLRLEAGLCLYGSDLDTGTTPVEADLGWTIARKYRHDGAATARFPGAGIILAQLVDAGGRRRVGLRPDGQAPVRAGTALLDGNSVSVGTVTSGGFGFTVGAPLAMGYVEARCAPPGTVLRAEVRGRVRTLTTATLPFVPHRYFQSKPVGVT